MESAVGPLLRSSRTLLVGVLDAVVARYVTQDVKPPTEHYHFQHPAVLQNVPPSTVIWNRPLRWWSLDRRKRVAAAMRLRDRMVEDILRVGGRKAECEPDPRDA